MFIPKEKIFDEHIDFLTLRVSRFENPLFITCLGCVENSPIINLDFGFRIEFSDVIYSGQKKILKILDSNNNTLGWVNIKNVMSSANTKVHDEIEFTSTFFTFYPQFLDYFLDIFNFDRKRSGVVVRIDYAIDILDYLVQEIYNTRIISERKHFPVVIDNAIQYFRYQNQRHKLVIYNKKLDVLDKGKQKDRSMDGKYPFKKYIQVENCVSRLEYRKNAQSMRDLENSSFDWLQENIHILSREYIERFLGITFSKDRWVYNTKQDVKRDVIFDKEIARKKALSLSRANAYIDSFRELEGERALFNYLESKFGNRLLRYLLKNQPDDIFVDMVFPEFPDRELYLSMSCRKHIRQKIKSIFKAN